MDKMILMKPTDILPKIIMKKCFIAEYTERKIRRNIITIMETKQVNIKKKRSRKVKRTEMVVNKR